MALTKAPEELLDKDLTSALSITVDDNSAALTLKSTDADANTGPELALTRDSSSPADDDFTGIISFNADDDGGNVTRFALIRSQIKDASDGSEDGSMDIKTMVAGSERSRVVFGSAETNFNEGGVDLDFRVEGDSEANLLFVDASTDRIGIGTNSPDGLLTIKGNSDAVSTPSIRLLDGTDTREVSISNTAGDFAVSTHGTDDAAHGQIKMFETGLVTISNGGASGSLTERLRIDASGNTLIGTSASRSLSGVTPTLFKEGTGYNDSAMALVGNTGTSAATAPLLLFGRSRGTSDGASTSVASGDRLGGIFFTGADGTDIESLAAVIQAKVDGTPGSNDMPGRLEFYTTPDGSETTVERMRIHSGGVVSISEGVELGNGFSGAASNTLDDYEEGTFTVSVNGCTESNATGYYIKVGDKVNFQYYTGASTFTAVQASFTGLPFTTSGSTQNYATFLTAHNTATTDAFGGYLNRSATTGYFVTKNSTSVPNYNTGTQYFMISGFYFTN